MCVMTAGCAKEPTHSSWLIRSSLHICAHLMQADTTATNPPATEAADTAAPTQALDSSGATEADLVAVDMSAAPQPEHIAAVEDDPDSITIAPGDDDTPSRRPKPQQVDWELVPFDVKEAQAYYGRALVYRVYMSLDGFMYWIVSYQQGWSQVPLDDAPLVVDIMRVRSRSRSIDCNDRLC